jgi:O-antigen/teichoic acid export membrane protein
MSHHQPGLTEKIIRNTAFNILGKSWGILVSLMLTPYIIHRIGLERFGIWAIVGLISGYFGLLDFSFGASFVKYISEHYTRREYKEISQVTNTGMIFYFFLSLCILGLFFLIVNPLVAFLKVPPALVRESIFVFFMGTVIFCAFNIFSSFTAVFDGLQRMDITNKIAIIMSLPNIAGTVFVLNKGYGLPGLMANSLAICLLSGSIAMVVSLRLLPELKLGPGYFCPKMFKKLFGFGLQLQVTRLAMLFNNSVVKLLSGHFLGLGIVGFFELGQKIVMLGRDASLLTVSGVMPAASEIHAKQDTAKVRELYIRACKYLHGLVLPVLVFTYAAAALIIVAWINSEYAPSILTIQILAPAHMVNMLTAVGVLISSGIGRPGIAARSMAITAVLNMTLNIVFIIKFGFAGVLVGTAGSLIIGSLFFIHSFNRLLKVPDLLFFEMTVLKPLLGSMLAAIAVSSMMWYYRFCSIPAHRMDALMLLAADAALFISVYLIYMLKSGFLDMTDRDNISKIFIFLRIKR